MIIIESYQIPEGNISPDIFNLPCIIWAIKDDKWGIIYSLNNSMAVGRFSAIPKDWICKRDDGKWETMTDEQYRMFSMRELVECPFRQSSKADIFAPQPEKSNPICITVSCKL